MYRGVYRILGPWKGGSKIWIKISKSDGSNIKISKATVSKFRNSCIKISKILDQISKFQICGSEFQRAGSRIKISKTAGSWIRIYPFQGPIYYYIIYYIYYIIYINTFLLFVSSSGSKRHVNRIPLKNYLLERKNRLFLLQS